MTATLQEDRGTDTGKFRLNATTGQEEPANGDPLPSIDQLRRGPRPLRHPDWRWKAAEEELGRRDFGTPITVKAIIRHVACELPAGIFAEGTDHTQSKLATIHDAYQIYAADDVLSWLIEAWILTSADDQTIADALELQPELVAVYAQLFYDVRDRLSAGGVMYHLINRELLKPRPLRVPVVQHMAYQAGPEALSAALSALGGPQGLQGRALPKVDLRAPEGREKARLQLAIELNALSPKDLSPFMVEELASWSNQTWLKAVPKREYRATWAPVLHRLRDKSHSAATEKRPAKTPQPTNEPISSAAIQITAA